MAEARRARRIHTLPRRRAVYTYAGRHSKTIIFGLIADDGRGYFERHRKFTTKEFVKFWPGPR